MASSSSQDVTCDTLSSISMNADHSYSILTPPSTPAPPPKPTCPSPDEVLSSFPLPDNTKTVYLSSLGPDVDPNYIRDLFRPYGLIKGLRVIWERDVDTIAFVEFEEQRSAEKAMSEIDKIIRKNSDDRHRKGNAATMTTKVSGRNVKEDDSEKIKVEKGKAKGGFTVFVGNTGNLTEEDLMEAFKPYGRLTRVFVMPHTKTGRPQSFAFVTFAEESCAGNAVRGMNGATVKKTTLRVEWEMWEYQRKAEEETKKRVEKEHKLERRMESKKASLGPENATTTIFGGFGQGKDHEIKKIKVEDVEVEKEKNRNLDVDRRSQKEFYYDKISKQSSPDNTTIFCCYKQGILTDQILRKKFSPFGKITGMKCYEKEGYGYIRFQERSSAISAIFEKNGVKPKSGGVVMVGWGQQQYIN